MSSAPDDRSDVRIFPPLIYLGGLPLKIDEKELADELKRTGVSKAAFLNQVHIQAFDPLFRRHKVEKADFTIFLVKSILDRDLNAHKGGQEPAGATPPKSGFCLVCDQMASETRCARPKRICRLSCRRRLNRRRAGPRS